MISIACLLGLVLVALLITSPAEGPRGSALAELRTLRRRPVVLALAVTAVGNVGVLMVFTYLAPLMTDLAGHPAGRLPVLLLAYGIGATIGNLVGGWLHDTNPWVFPPVLLGVLAAVLACTWLIARMPTATALSVVIIGAAGFAVIPGMQARVMRAASAAPTLSMAVNASAYQVAAACAGMLGGVLADSGAGLRPVYLVSAALTACGLLLTIVSSCAHASSD